MSSICMSHTYTRVMLNMTYQKKAKCSSNMLLQIVFQGLIYSYFHLSIISIGHYLWGILRKGLGIFMTRCQTQLIRPFFLIFSIYSSKMLARLLRAILQNGQSK